MPPPDLTEKERALVQMGHATAAYLVTLLRQHGPCDCVPCQFTALEAATRWVCHGEPADQILEQVNITIHNLLNLRRDVKRAIAFHEACTAAGITVGQTQGNA